ncbi:cupredoxin domain-containing protein [Nitrosopumilus piranensis]|uniref:Uncharacterized protein n=1 Tax=Nitrosopumilus piranensis TaxID=1582439 RepID=A0A0C5BT88_9ARCH|nr:hypothetical protein [Nitrosopumilus piranensis]AJM91481.1 conserved exported protein of unknown function [Nitrosopumilus piranensis]
MKLAVSLLTLLIAFSGYLFNESFAEISENQPFLLEGSGFAVTEEQIKLTEIDLGLSTQMQRGSSINFVIDDGFVTLNDEEFIITELEGKFLREGRYIRINGNIESSTGFDTTISFFGRLVAESKDAAVYGFTGRITTPDETHKIIYTTKLSSLSKIDVVKTPEESKEITIRIIKGASLQGGSDSYIGLSTTGSNAQRLGYFSSERISIGPDTTIKIVNDDVVPHSLVSGIIVGSERNLNNGNICRDVDTSLAKGFSTFGERSEVYNCDFVVDERVDTGMIAPGKSVNITFSETGFYRLIDPDYGWMRIIAYVFPDSDNLLLRQGQNLGN